MDLRVILQFVYNLIIARVPGLARILSYQVLVSVAEAIEIGLEAKLKVDMNLTNWQELLDVLKEAGEAVLIATEQEQIEAVWYLLKYVTNVEEHLTYEMFVDRVKDLPPPAPTAA